MGAYLKVCKGGTYSKNQYFPFFIAMLFYKQSIFDPCPKNCFSFSKK